MDHLVTMAVVIAGGVVAYRKRLEPKVLDRGYTQSEDGTGLGLAIVDSIASARGWSIEVTESESGGRASSSTT